MKGISSLLLLCLFCTCGCTGIVLQSHQAYYQHLDQRRKQILEMAASEKVKVDAGVLRQSDYWREYYARVISERPDWSNALFLTDEMTKISILLEEGTITREQYEDKYLELNALYEKDEVLRVEILSRPHTLHTYEIALFTLHLYSSFRTYEEDLRKQVKEAGPHATATRCAVFDGKVQCISPPRGLAAGE